MEGVSSRVDQAKESAQEPRAQNKEENLQELWDGMKRAVSMLSGSKRDLTMLKG